MEIMTCKHSAKGVLLSVISFTSDLFSQSVHLSGTCHMNMHSHMRKLIISLSSRHIDGVGYTGFAILFSLVQYTAHTVLYRSAVFKKAPFNPTNYLPSLKQSTKHIIEIPHQTHSSNMNHTHKPHIRIRTRIRSRDLLPI